MRSSPLLSTTALTIALVLGCRDQPVPSEPADPPTLSELVNPLASARTELSPGAFVIRGPEFAFFTSDPAEAGFPPPNITLMIGWTFAQLLDFCATGELTFSDLVRLFVIRPHSTEEVPDWHTMVHSSQSPLLVWETAIPFIDPLAELCNLALTVPHLEGTGQMTSTDNDLFVTGKRANAFHTGVTGTVTSESGQRFRVWSQAHAVILPSGELLRFTLDNRLDPIGH
jgi:hypothetical protein